jgi:hypothetical protein
MAGQNQREKLGFRSGSLGSSISLQSIVKVKYMVDTAAYYARAEVARVLFDPAPGDPKELQKKK